jgi:hypothetical protein
MFVIRERLYVHPIYTTPHKNKASYGFFIFIAVVLQPNVDHGLLILDVSRSHTKTHQSGGLLWMSNQLVAETST